MKDLDQVTRAIGDAKASDDLAETRTALDRAQKPLADMRVHMSGCMNMMSMMQRMPMMRGQGAPPPMP